MTQETNRSSDFILFASLEPEKETAMQQPVLLHRNLADLAANLAMEIVGSCRLLLV